MDTLMFGGGGLFFFLFGLFLSKKHADFVSKSITINGRVVDVVDKTSTSHGAFGQVTEQRTIKVPVVQYKYNKLYEFKAEVDSESHNLEVNSYVDVLLDPSKPKTAKLTIGAKQSTLVFKLMMGLGLFNAGIGVWLFNPKNFYISFDPFVSVVTLIVLLYLYVKVWPMVRMLPYLQMYYDNAVEVDK